jgi:hypothetical protein
LLSTIEQARPSLSLSANKKKRALCNASNTSSSSSSATTTSSTKQVYYGRPEEDIPGGWPDGWMKRTFQRPGGQKQRFDRYWYTPQMQYKLRSIVEIKKFMQYLKDSNGDEETAYAYLKGLQRS